MREIVAKAIQALRLIDLSLTRHRARLRSTAWRSVRRAVQGANLLGVGRGRGQLELGTPGCLLGATLQLLLAHPGIAQPRHTRHLAQPGRELLGLESERLRERLEVPRRGTLAQGAHRLRE